MESHDIPKGQATAHTRRYFNISRCVLGNLIITVSEQGICWVALGDDSESLTAEVCHRYPNAVFSPSHEALNHYLNTMQKFIHHPTAELILPLDVDGTVFQKRVWNAIQGISMGATATYQQIASQIGSPRSVRAVAGACASNPVAVVIPCHRVVRRDGRPSGYRWGLGRKNELLHRENLFGIRSLGVMSDQMDRPTVTCGE